MFFFCNGMVQFFIRLTVPCIETIVSNHFEVFFRNVTDKPLNEIKNRNCFDYKFLILVAVVVKSNIFSIIVINTRGGDYWSSKITPNVFSNSRGITFIWFCINIKPIFMIFIDRGLHFFKGSSHMFLQFI
jgi:hypothetical protein